MTSIPILFGQRGPKKSYNFLNGSLPSDLTFTRASNAWYWNPSGILTQASSNTPRFDYNPSTLALRGLLLEESRTNVVFPSVPDNAINWVYTNTTFTLAATVAPDGTTTGVAVNDKAQTSNFNANEAGSSPSFINGTTYTISCFAKANTQSVVQLTGYSAAFGSSQYANFNLANGTLGSSSGGTATIQNVGNGWYRCAFTITANASINGVALNIVLVNNNTSATRSPTYTGTGTGIYIWGAQTETGPFATSHIPTTTATVTRALDALKTTSIPWFNTTQGTMATSLLMEGLSSVNMVPAVLSDGSTNNQIRNYIQTNGQSFGNIVVSNVGVSSIASAASANTTSVSKFGISYISGGNKSAFSGVLNADGALLASTIPSGINRLDIGNVFDGSRTANCWVQSFRYWNTALTTTKLQQVTT